MADRIPFTARIRIVPNRGSGKRFEIQRSREYMAHMIYDDLATYAATELGTGGTEVNNDLTLAEPGGGVALTLQEDEFSSIMYGGAVKPQFGEDPDIVTIVGFCTINEDLYTDLVTDPPVAEVNIISSMTTHNGTSMSGPGQATIGWRALNGPTPQTSIGATALKDTIEGAITVADASVVSLDFKGIKYGWGGFHFNN